MERVLAKHPEALDSARYGTRVYLILPEQPGSSTCKVVLYDLALKPLTPRLLIRRCINVEVARVCIEAAEIGAKIKKAA